MRHSKILLSDGFLRHVVRNILSFELTLWDFSDVTEIRADLPILGTSASYADSENFDNDESKVFDTINFRTTDTGIFALD